MLCGNLITPFLSISSQAYLRPLYCINSPSESKQSLNTGQSSKICFNFEFDSNEYVKWWFNIADSTVYSTLKTLEKKEYIIGTTEKVGNMPDRTVYSLSDKGKDEFIATLRTSILKFNYDTNIFSIAAFFLNTFSPCEQRELLQKRLKALQKYREGIEKQINPLWENEVSAIHSANVKRMIDLVDAEITGTNRLLDSCSKND